MLPTNKKVTKKQRVLEAVSARGWKTVGSSEWAELRIELPDVSESTMREALRSTGFEVLPPWCGVEQHTLEQLERSLRALTVVYLEDQSLRRYCREMVIEAKARARWVARSPRVQSRKREIKAEMVEWMLIWLGDPSIFPAWVDLRRRGVVKEL